MEYRAQSKQLLIILSSYKKYYIDQKYSNNILICFKILDEEYFCK